MRREKVEGRHHFMIMEASEIMGASRNNRKWMNFQNRLWNISLTEFDHKAEVGDMTYVTRSEQFLSEIEDIVPVSRAWKNVDDVVGAVPNVPAFLAGHPQCMRRRMRADKESAPLAIFMNLTSSAVISAETVLRRGIVLLALVRLLIEHRPVELWVGSALDDGYISGTSLWRIDTAPLDLARAAFHIADISMSRLFGYAMCETLVDKHLGGGHNNVSAHTRRLKQVTGWQDLMYIPALDIYDQMVQNPVGWVKNAMKQYVGGDSNDE